MHVALLINVRNTNIDLNDWQIKYTVIRTQQKRIVAIGCWYILCMKFRCDICKSETETRCKRIQHKIRKTNIYTRNIVCKKRANQRRKKKMVFFSLFIILNFEIYSNYSERPLFVLPRTHMIPLKNENETNEKRRGKKKHSIKLNSEVVMRRI